MAQPDAQHAEFDTAFAQAAVPDPASPLPHYPAQRYIDKNLAPEKTLTHGDVSALAAAAKHAVTKKVLPSEIAEHMLPMAMVEGRPDFGVNNSSGFYPSAATVKRFKSMGLSIADLRDPAMLAKFTPDGVHESPPGVLSKFKYSGAMTNDLDNPGGPLVREKVPFVQPDADAIVYPATTGKEDGGRLPAHPPLLVRGYGDSSPEVNARFMAAVLAEKHASNAAKDVSGTVRLYNGTGVSAQTPGAGVAQYFKKVQDAKAMLAHPKNKPLMDHFNATYTAEE